VPPRLLDAVERVAVFALYSWLVWRILQGAGLEFGKFQLLSEGMIVVFLLFRRPAQSISPRPMDWVLAFVATTAPLLVTGGLGDGHLPIRVVTLLWLLGFIAQVGAKLWLGRNFGLVAARRQLVLGGPYRFMRHPMYFGYLVTHLAVLGMNPSMSNAGFYLLSWVAQLPRLLAEERVLSEDLAYADYMRAVRWRLVPGIW
jgi:protein-S-isoprenylcysteine O-methyltransferase Ste14